MRSRCGSSRSMWWTCPWCGPTDSAWAFASHWGGNGVPPRRVGNSRDRDRDCEDGPQPKKANRGAKVNADRGIGAPSPERPPTASVGAAENQSASEPRQVVIAPRSLFILVAIFLGSVLLLATIYAAREIVAELCAAIILAMAIEPLVQALQQRGLSRGGAVSLTFVLAFLATMSFAWVLFPPLVEEVTSFARHLPDKARHFLDERREQHPCEAHRGEEGENKCETHRSTAAESPLLERLHERLDRHGQNDGRAQLGHDLAGRVDRGEQQHAAEA